MTNKLSKQYNYAEMSVLNLKSIKVTNGENKCHQRGGGVGGMIHFVNSRVARDTVWELDGARAQTGNWRRARDAVWELEGCTSSSQ